MSQNEHPENTVVLIEDNPDDAELAMRSLNSFQHKNELVWLKDGAAAIQYLFAEPPYDDRPKIDKPKLILLDLKLPKVDGQEVLRRIKSDEELKTIPVVVMTSSKETVDLKTCYELGANSFVTKPINYKEFIETTKNVSMYWLLVNQTPK